MVRIDFIEDEFIHQEVCLAEFLFFTAFEFCYLGELFSIIFFLVWHSFVSITFRIEFRRYPMQKFRWLIRQLLKLLLLQLLKLLVILLCLHMIKFRLPPIMKVFRLQLVIVVFVHQIIIIFFFIFLPFRTTDFNFHYDGRCDFLVYLVHFFLG